MTARFDAASQSTPESWLDQLNLLQRKAVEHRGGPLAILAGPGTGKTRVLTTRIWHLIRSETARPSWILAITFTNQAAREIQARLEAMLPGGREVPKVTTFHQWSLEFLKGLPGMEAYNPVDEAGARELKIQAARDVGVEARRISRVAESLGLAKQFWPPGLPDMDEETEKALRVYQAYLGRYKLWDYDDLILEAVRVLEGANDLRDQVQKSLPFLLVDEFQDVSPAQYQLIKCLAQPGSDVTVIGDPDQAIYGFRGASPEFIYEFQRDFHPVTTITLKSCYRCPQIVLDAAQAVLSSDKGLESEMGQGQLIIRRSFKSPSSEARWVAGTIEELSGGLSFDAINFGQAGSGEAMPLDSIAVLFRTRVVGDVVAEALSQRGIPFQRADRRDSLSAMGLLPVHHLFEVARGRNREYHLGRLERELKKHKRQALHEFLQEVRGANGPDLLRRAMDFLGMDEASPQARLLNRLAETADEIASLTLLLRNEADLLEIKIEGVRLLSLHAAKGLEFPVVFIVGCDHGVLPWDDSPLDEEKRLFYVGLTRASKRLYLSSSGRKTLQGKTLPGTMSPLLSAIPSNLFEAQPGGPVKKTRRSRKPKQKRLF